MMCGICGCDAAELSPDKTAPELALAAPVKPATAATQTIALHQNLLHANNHQAAHNRAWFSRHRLSAINLVSSPGAGKTTLLEQTLTRRDRAPPSLAA
jgi:hydrogenase nickel incorporation protein HypB